MKEEKNNGFLVSQDLMLRDFRKWEDETDYWKRLKKAVMELDRNVVQKISTNLSIGFVPEKERVGEVCFMNSEEVRPEFKVSFAPVDIENYIVAALLSPDFVHPSTTISESNGLNIPYPKDAVDFWTLVERGKQWRTNSHQQ